MNTKAKISMDVRLIVVMAIMIMASAPAIAFSPTAFAANKDDASLRPQPASCSGISSGISSSSSTPLRYKNEHVGYYDILDVDGDRMSLRSLLDPPAAPREAPKESTKPQGTSNDTTTPISSRTIQRTLPITQLHSIQDYHRHVLHEPNQLCIIRFSAPWCKVCRITNVAWERMASKIHKMNSVPDDNTNGSKRIKFLSVNLDGNDEATVALKDMLQIKRIPQGIIHHPTQGVFGQKVDLNRSNLSILRKRLESYLGEDGMTSGMVWDVGLHP